MTLAKKKKVSPFRIFVSLFLILGILMILFPMYLVLIMALKTPAETAENFFALPESFYLGNFKAVLEKADFVTAFQNSAYITVCSSIILVIFVPMIGYAIARNYNHPFYRFVFILFILGMFVPFQVVMLPQIQILQELNLMSRTGLILIYAAVSLIGNVFLMVGYIRAIPKDLEEAAYIDGASTLRTFFFIVFPVVRPVITTIVIMHVLFVWNDYLLPLIVLNKDKAMYTLPLFQMSLRGQYSFDYNTTFAAYLVSILIVTVVYTVFQKQIIGGIMDGAIKN